jgi:hypothetical protein
LPSAFDTWGSADDRPARDPGQMFSTCALSIQYQRANWRRNSVPRGRRNQNRVALANEG